MIVLASFHRTLVVKLVVVSHVTFEHDFESHFKKLFQVRTNLVNRSYERYKQSLVKSRENARAKNSL